MTKWNEIKNQILASTQLDSQGERQTKKSLESLCELFKKKQRLPLNQQHDMNLDAVGYIDNFRVVPSSDGENEWSLIGDVYFHDVELDEALKGFSYSITEDMQGNLSKKEVGVYVPYPFYQNDGVLKALAATGDGVVSGAWRKKAADPGTVSLVVSFVLFVAAPAYTNYWNNKISPLLKELVSNLKNGKSTEYAQVSKGHLGETYGIYFVPPRGTDSKYLTLSLIIDGIRAAENHVNGDDLAKNKGVHLVKLVYSNDHSAYQLKSVEYNDGSIVNH